MQIWGEHSQEMCHAIRQRATGKHVDNDGSMGTMGKASITRGVSPSINAAMGQGDVEEMKMVTGCMVYGAGVGTNEMKGYGLKEDSITLATLGDENNT